jgi:hypothetical protein
MSMKKDRAVLRSRVLWGKSYPAIDMKQHYIQYENNMMSISLASESIFVEKAWEDQGQLYLAIPLAFFSDMLYVCRIGLCTYARNTTLW